ncbi:MAG TPA: hypothetical protein VLO11_06320 [Luteolibacter sp.]|nr:hypothetical protein [Luteolibacter sp.]
MNFEGLMTLGSIEAIRPVFWMVMGVFIFIYAWRLAQRSAGWTARLLVAGALMLAFGYTFVLPMYEAGVLERFAEQRRHYHGSAGTALAWNVVKVTVMNFGWLVFGAGMALHAGLVRLPVRKALPGTAIQPIPMQQTPRPAHELAA